jgi:hypothetical protein
VTALVATELVTNAVAATTKMRWTTGLPPVRVWLRGGPSVVAVLVWDAAVTMPAPQSARDDDESGRGLAIVAALSARWGFYYPAQFCGKVTWAVLDTP